MQKLLKILALTLTLSFVLNNTLIKAEDSAEPQFASEKRFDDLLEKLEIDKNDLNLEKIFEEDEGQNLYLAAYYLQDILPLEDTFARISTKYTFYNYENESYENLSSAEIKNFMINGTISSEYTGPTYSSMQSTLNTIKDRFDSELDLEAFKNDLEKESIVNEIFVNGDTSDSGFDLLYDLQVIETILFKETETKESSEITDDNESVSPSEFIKTLEQAQQEVQAIENTIDETVDNIKNPSNSNSTNNSNNQDNTNDDQPTTESAQAEQNNTTAANENVNTDLNTIEVCAEDFESQKAFEEYLIENPNVIVKETPDSDTTENETNQNPENPTNTETVEDIENTDTTNLTSDEIVELLDAIKPEDPFNLQDVLPCNKYFCLKVSFQDYDDKEDKILTFEKEDNCIACHIQYINNNLYELNSHGLVPNKVTGNILENPKCKKAFNEISPGLNITAFKQPVLPVAKETELSNNFDDMLKDLKDIYGGWGDAYDKVNPAPKTLDEQIADEDFSNPYSAQDQKIIQYSSGDLTNIANAINQNREEVETQAAQKMELRIIETQIETEAKGFQELEMQMILMNSFFESFIDLFNQISESDGSACEILNEKEFCS